MTAPAEGSQGALAGLKVLDLSRVLAGPMAAQLLGDCGAEVIKVERPGQGDDARRLGGVPAKGRSGEDLGLGPMFVCANRNKRSMTVNISQPQGQAIIRKLAGWADVLIENYKAGDLARYGLDYAALHEVNPRLVYCSITGFGQTGPYAQRAGYDAVFQAMSGLMSVTGHPDGIPGGGPMRVGVPLADTMGGYYAFGAVLAAVYHRDHVSGEGQHIDLALLDATVSAMTIAASNYLISGARFQRAGVANANAVPTQLFQCADGQVQISAPTNEGFVRLCGVLGRPELARDARFSGARERVQNRGELLTLLDGLLIQWRRADLVAALEAAGVASAPLYAMEEVFEDEQIRHRGNPAQVEHPQAGPLKMAANPIHFSASPVTIRRPPPLLGADTDAVLQEVLGLTPDEVRALHESRVV